LKALLKDIKEDREKEGQEDNIEEQKTHNGIF
jgi:hypothetical protein